MIFDDKLHRQVKNTGSVYGHQVMLPYVIVTKWSHNNDKKGLEIMFKVSEIVSYELKFANFALHYRVFSTQAGAAAAGALAADVSELRHQGGRLVAGASVGE